MSYRRSAAAAIVYNNSLYIFGGYDGNTDRCLNASEIINENGDVRKSTDLPMSLYYHAVTFVNDSFSIITGGTHGNWVFESKWFDPPHTKASNLSWYFNHMTQKFSEGPVLLRGRIGHTSGTLVDKGTKEKIPIVAGGLDMHARPSARILDSTEILFNGKWIEGE